LTVIIFNLKKHRIFVQIFKTYLYEHKKNNCSMLVGIRRDGRIGSGGEV
jgi:hypothetical protein